MSALSDRCHGILLPVFSLPTGTLDGAEDFIGFLQQAGSRIWQVLPLGPTHADLSPYLALSAKAGNPRLIGMRLLSEHAGTPVQTLEEAYVIKGAEDLASGAFDDFHSTHGDWLNDYALFSAIRQANDGNEWFTWPDPLRHRDAAALKLARNDYAETIRFTLWVQFIFFTQWETVRRQCQASGIAIFGDIPLYVSHDSADVWQHQSLFQLDEDGHALQVAGVPPDYFSPDGQLWGNPLFDWPAMKEDGYTWWVSRVNMQAQLFDIVRIDHFRGLESYWQIPGDATSAKTGEWVSGPGADFLETLTRETDITFVAEDLGIITTEVDKLRRAYAMPGIRVLQFGFDGVHDNPHAPQNVDADTVLYTGTHDNNTSLGWYTDLTQTERDVVDSALAFYERAFPESLTACLFASHVNVVIVPLQDLLGLDSVARINTPGTVVNNWQWRLDDNWEHERALSQLQDLCREYGR